MGRLAPAADAGAAERAHPGMQLPSLTGQEQTEEAVDAIASGSEPTSGARSYRPVVLLGRHTATPERCWFAQWDGWAALKEDVRRAATFELPSRRYFLLHGPLEAVLDRDPAARHYHRQPALWWPDDRAWCLATEIDMNTTYVGCSRACAEALVASPRLEAAATDPATGVAFDSDELNRR